jgi:replicative DNA helicase
MEVAQTERAVLAVCLLEPSALTRAMIEGVRVEWFTEPLHIQVWRAIAELDSDGMAVDIITVTNRLKALTGEPHYAEVASLTAAAASSAHLESHVEILRAEHLRRQLIALGANTAASAGLSGANPMEVLEKTESALHGLSEALHGIRPKTTREVIIEAIRQSDARASNKLTGVPSGYPVLDTKTGGWQPDDLIILAARPSMGKTAMALNMAYNAAMAGSPVLFFSLEMSAVALMTRMLAHHLQIDHFNFKNGRNVNWKHVQTEHEALAKAPIQVDETAALSLPQLRSKARIWHARQKGRNCLIVVDYLGLMHLGERAENRVQEVAKVSAGLKALAKTLHVPVLALSQLRRGESKGAPELHDLRDSGAIEQDADVVMFLHCDSYYGGGEDGLNNVKRELLIRKNRNGAIGALELDFNKSTQSLRHGASFESQPTVAPF